MSSFWAGFILGTVLGLVVDVTLNVLPPRLRKWRRRDRRHVQAVFTPRSTPAPTNGRVKATGPRVRSARYVDERAHRNSIDKRDERQ